MYASPKGPNKDPYSRISSIIPSFYRMNEVLNGKSRESCSSGSSIIVLAKDPADTENSVTLWDIWEDAWLRREAAPTPGNSPETEKRGNKGVPMRRIRGRRKMERSMREVGVQTNLTLIGDI